MSCVMRMLALALTLVGCSAPVRFENRETLWHDPDDRAIAVPKKREPRINWVFARDASFQPADQALALAYGREAVNVNAMDETPDSSWYLNRRRVPGQSQPRAFSATELQEGNWGGAPRPVLPFTVLRGKADGANVGFIAKDALGRQFMIKFDPPGFVGLDTSTEVVVSRLAWAAGWYTPAEAVLDIRPWDLVLSPEATNRVGGKKVPLDAEELQRFLAQLPLARDGLLRVSASLWIDGITVGPFQYFGRRDDDPNDRVRHEDRRDLRGYGVFCAWVNSTDTTEMNTLDAYVGKPGHGHLVHYQQDVGASFGARSTAPSAYWMGNESYFSSRKLLTSLVTLGLATRPWDGEQVRVRRAREVAEYPELGFFDAESLRPRDWHPAVDNAAFDRATRRDHYWGVKRLVELSGGELRAIIGEGHYRSAAAERLFQILWQRRQRLARAYLAGVAALDYFRVEGERLCWDDVWLNADLGGADDTVYRANGHATTTRCAPLAGKRGYRIVGLQARRPGDRSFGPTVRVHLIDRHIVGVER